MMDGPLYLQIADSLRQAILSGTYRPSDMLPSENELATLYATSRVTVRKSLAGLESEGLIKPRHGKGYFVLPPQNTMYTLYFGEQAAGGQFRFQEVNILVPEKKVVETLGLEQGQMAILTRRVLERDGKSVAYDEKYIPYERGVPSIEFEIGYAEFPDMFNKRFAPMSLRTEMTIGVETAPEYVCASLGLAAGTQLLVVGRRICTKEGKPVGCGRQYLTGDYGKLTAESGYYKTEKL